MKRTNSLTRITSMFLACLMLFSAIVPNVVFADETTDNIAVGTFIEPGDKHHNMWQTNVNVTVKDRTTKNAIKDAVVTIVVHDYKQGNNGNRTYSCKTDASGKAKFVLLVRWNEVVSCIAEYNGNESADGGSEIIRLLESVHESKVNYNLEIDVPKCAVTYTAKCGKNTINGVRGFETQTVEKGTSVEEVTAPEKIEIKDSNDFYQFINWTKGTEELEGNKVKFDNVTENIDLVANYELVENFEVTYTAKCGKNTINGVRGFETQTVKKYDSTVKVEAPATIPVNNNKVYNFVNWTDGTTETTERTLVVENVEDDMDFVANYKLVEKVTLKHVLEFWNDRTEISSEDVVKGTNEEYLAKALEGYVKPKVEIKDNEPTIKYWAKKVVVEYYLDGIKIDKLTESVLLPWQNAEFFGTEDKDAFAKYVTRFEDGKIRINHKDYREVYREVKNSRALGYEKDNTLAIVKVTLEKMPKQITVNHYLFYTDTIGDKLIATEVVDEIENAKINDKNADLTRYAYSKDKYTLHEQFKGASKAIKIVNDHELNIYYWAKRVDVRYVAINEAGQEIDVQSVRANEEQIISYNTKFDNELNTYADYINTNDIEFDGVKYAFDSTKSNVTFPEIEDGNGAVVTVIFNEVVIPKDLTIKHYLMFYSEKKLIKETKGYKKDLVEDEDGNVRYSAFVLPGYVLDTNWNNATMKKAEKADNITLYYWAKKLTLKYVLDGTTVKTVNEYYNFNEKEFDNKIATYDGMYEDTITLDGKTYKTNNKSLKVMLRGITDPTGIDQETKTIIHVEITADVSRVYNHTHKFAYENCGKDGHRKYCTEKECDYSVNEKHNFVDGVCICGEIQLKKLDLGKFEYSSYNEETFIARANEELEEHFNDEEFGNVFADVKGEWEITNPENNTYVLTARVNADYCYEATITFTVFHRSHKKKKAKLETMLDDATPLGNFSDLDRVEDLITRAEFTEVVAKLFAPEDKGKGKNFKDINENTNKEIIDTMTKYGLTAGYDEETFGPNDLITNEQIMNILVRGLIANNKSITLTEEEVNAEIAKALDGQNVSDWAEELVAVAMRLGLIEKDANGNINPLGNKTRGDVNVLFKKYLVLLYSSDDDNSDKE